MIDYPGLVIPVGSSVDPALDHVDTAFQATGPEDSRHQAYCESNTVICVYSDIDVILDDSPEDFAGAPLAVQLVCRRFREEECIGLGGLIANALKTTN